MDDLFLDSGEKKYTDTNLSKGFLTANIDGRHMIVPASARWSVVPPETNDAIVCDRLVGSPRNIGIIRRDAAGLKEDLDGCAC